RPRRSRCRALPGGRLDAHARTGPEVLLAFDDDAFAGLHAAHDRAIAARVLDFDLAHLRGLVLHDVDDAPAPARDARGHGDDARGGVFANRDAGVDVLPGPQHAVLVVELRL